MSQDENTDLDEVLVRNIFIWSAFTMVNKSITVLYCTRVDWWIYARLNSWWKYARLNS